MPVSWTEIRERATAFARRWKDEGSERAESQTFWGEFFAIFGVDRKRVAVFEQKVRLRRAKALGEGRIDLFWPGKLLIEMKSAGADLARAFDQATDYFDGLPERDLPRYVLVSDFRRFRLHDFERNVAHPEFTLDRLPDRIRLFGFIAGYEVQPIRAQDPVNIRAAERMGLLHDTLKAAGYTGHALEVLLVRLLFCLFADDTGIFQPAGRFREWIESDTREDGSDLGRALAELFDVLNTSEAERPVPQREAFGGFPYVNGRLFAERLPVPPFDRASRDRLLDACALDWSAISPAIFGALFQSIMDPEARRNLGAHYTSEENIQKLIGPLFLDALRAEFERIRQHRAKLFDFQKKLRRLTFLDPACGCGNFLVITYRELRRLEFDVLRAVHEGPGSRHLDIHMALQVNVDQFHGIEIEEFPAQIAQVALWLIDHQMNRLVGEEFGDYYARIPLVTSPHIVHGNALRLDWADILPPGRCSYVLGNPPFVGAKFIDEAQRADARAVFMGIDNAGLLDLVAAWYVKAAHYLRAAKAEGDAPPRVAFVSTNSITQGEQVGVLWGWLLAQGVKIHFAHRTFKWSNEASGKAAVHCVIIGLGLDEPPTRTIFDYADPTAEPHAITVSHINPYLVEAPDVLLTRRSRPICEVPEIGIGSQPIDDGQYLFTPEQKAAFLREESAAEPYFFRWLGGEEFINGIERWVLWLGRCPPDALRRMPRVLERVKAVQRFRFASRREQTRKAAERPQHFGTEIIPEAPYLVLPEVSSERRRFIPVGFASADVLCSNKVRMLPDASLTHFGVLTSTMHNAWVRAVTGRLESRYQYSAFIVYNNFPWPSAVLPSAQDEQSARLRAAVEAAAQGVLDARAAHPDASLADLYDPLTMPADLARAHAELDRAVDAAYVPDGGKRRWASEAERVAFLFTRYQALTSLLPAEAPTARRRGRRSSVG